MPCAFGISRWRRPGPPSSARSPSWPALSVSSNAACTCSGGCTLCTLTLTIRMPVFSRSSWAWIDLTRSLGDGVALLVQRRSILLRPTISRTGLGGLHHGRLGVAVLEQVGARSLRRYCTVKRMSTMFSSCVSIDESRRPVACEVELRPISTSELGHADRFVGLERIRKRHGAGLDRVAVAAERGDDRLLAFLHDEQAAAEPDQGDDAADQRRRRRRRCVMSGWKLGPRRRIAAAVAAPPPPLRPNRPRSLRLKSRQSSSRSGGPSLWPPLLAQRQPPGRAAGAAATFSDNMPRRRQPDTPLVVIVSPCVRSPRVDSGSMLATLELG